MHMGLITTRHNHNYNYIYTIVHVVRHTHETIKEPQLPKHERGLDVT